VEIQNQVSDIVQFEQYDTKALLTSMLDQCVDQLETLVEEAADEGHIIETLRQRIDNIYGAKDLTAITILLDMCVEQRLEILKPQFSHRNLQVTCDFKPQEAVFIPREALEIIVDGLIKNAIENTPDGGKIEILVQQKGNGAVLAVRDYGVGILENARKRIFEGFFPTNETLSYSSKRPFDFNAGGKGADLLRMRIFSERYGFKIDMSSNRCQYIPKEGDICPGSIQDCPHCSAVSDCHQSGGSTFSLYFPPQTKQKEIHFKSTPPNSTKLLPRQ
jgi:signal transduction histidine kinase